MNLKAGDFLRLLYKHDQDTFDHCVRVAKLCMRLATYTGLNRSEAQLLVFSGQMHDVGKVLVPTEILTSSEPLDDFGFGEIRKHPGTGAQIAKIVGRGDAAGLIVAHHEPGYPRGKTRDPEPESVLKDLLRLADQLDALRSSRPYKPAFGPDQCRRILLQNGFNGALIDLLLPEYEAH